MTFLCLCSRPKDVNRPKAVVAAEFINKRIQGCNVVPYLFLINQFLAGNHYVLISIIIRNLNHHKEFI